ncbi:hypothetical protein RclHR1_13650005 [Rhizophagus clarus]|uniref:Reverse transcriptase domain-containing protein n=1 Tax=Rhizophagus clarus TaxID=94130 RepID=A0A2Z6QR58_9GLOM|nr:hypothetical protein RclHR1_13650005 [Rhizophagus clarus]
MEDAKVKKKPLWILFQDLLKAYDRVDIKMLEELDKENVMISSQAYMDDVFWITDTSYKLESILQIADEFNKLNNIQINPEKFALLTNDTNALKDKSIKLNFGSHVQEIQLIHPAESQLTDKMMRYIYNAVIIPSIEYKSQHTILNNKQVAALNILAYTLFKKKTNLVMTIPNCMIHSSLEYAIKDISTIQLQYQVTRLHNQLQNKVLLGTLSKLSIIRLQQETLSVNNVLTKWKIYLKDLKIKYNLIASTLAIMYDKNLTCRSNIEHKIMGG